MCQFINYSLGIPLLGKIFEALHRRTPKASQAETRVVGHAAQNVDGIQFKIARFQPKLPDFSQ
ncbi:MAG: hypothetical protein CMQ11_16370, partial [Gammaproteobacteria bacterium]|nr:hypothetical protein [Gammaproteobacteria bacterium]